MQPGWLTNGARAVCLALFVGPCPFNCLGGTLSPDQEKQEDATRELSSWSLYEGDHYAKPESPRQFLNRLGPRLEHEAASDALVDRMKRATIPALNFNDSAAGETFGQINRLIQTHNAQHPASWIPPVADRSIPPDMDKPSPSPTDFSSLNSQKITLKLPEGSLWDAISYIAGLTGLQIIPESNAIWLVSPASGGYVLTSRSYIIPHGIFSNSKEAEAVLEELGLAPGQCMTTWHFDQKSRLFQLKTGPIDRFEIWYAHELLKNGYTHPPLRPEGAVSSYYPVGAAQTNHLDPLVREATAVMDLPLVRASPTWRQEKEGRLRKLILSLCHVDQWINAHPKIPDAAMAPPAAPEGLPEGSDPSLVKDPVKRNAYADALAKATSNGYAIDDRITAQFLYANELNYTFLFVEEFFDPSETATVKTVIDDNTRGQNLRVKAKTDFDSIVKQVGRIAQ